MSKPKLQTTVIRHRDNDPLRKQHLEYIASLERELAETCDRALLPFIQNMYEQLNYYDKLKGYNL